MLLKRYNSHSNLVGRACTGLALAVITVLPPKENPFSLLLEAERGNLISSDLFSVFVVVVDAFSSLLLLLLVAPKEKLFMFF